MRYFGIRWSNHPGWKKPQPFNCLGKLPSPKTVRVIECLHGFDETTKAFHQLALFEDGDYFLTTGTYRVSPNDPLEYWVRHEKAQSRDIAPFKTGMGDRPLQYVAIDARSRTATTKRGGGSSSRLTLWQERDPPYCLLP